MPDAQPLRPDAQPALLDAQLNEFFGTFSRATEALDADALEACFDEVFLAADATGAKAVPRPLFLQALPRRKQMADEAGIGPVALSSLTHQELDQHYVLARAEWTAPRSTGGQPVRLSSSFLLYRGGDRLRIVCYLSHQGQPLSTTVSPA